jgi:transcriptional regulator with XRE-family HTH domain
MDFGESLKSQLQYSGMLVKELSALSGVKKKTIDSYLGNKGYTPSVYAAVNIAKALGVSVEYLVTGKKSAKERPLSSLPKDIQEITFLAEQLKTKDRQIILALIRLLKGK